MAFTKAMLLSTTAVALTVVSVISSAHAAEAPAPGPVSASGVVSPSFVYSCVVGVGALILGSALRI